MNKKEFEYIRAVHKSGYENFAKIVSLISIFGIYVSSGSHLALVLFSASLICLLLAFFTSVQSAEFYFNNKPDLSMKYTLATKFLNLLTLQFVILAIASLVISILTKGAL